MNTSRLSSRLLMVAALSLAVSACGAPEEETSAPASADTNSPVFSNTFEMDENGQVVQAVDASCPHCVPTGWYDSQVNGVASGWVCASAFPYSYFNVTVYKYEGYYWRTVGAGYANLPRDPAVGANCGGVSNHGFNIQFAPQGAGTYRVQAYAPNLYGFQRDLSGT